MKAGEPSRCAARRFQTWRILTAVVTARGGLRGRGDRGAALAHGGTLLGGLHAAAGGSGGQRGS
jgi:hypothetical protein